ncbi:alpha/beta fold hydrolase [Streptomyces sp. NPDC090306]|uniref:alpha/beta fold hydrolase n=1 Tax=unclassified Streptomyces TaxID=2593676 RepID=UPI0036EE0A6F
MPRFTSDDGVEIAYEVWECESALPLVLLHHGFIADGRTNWQAPGIVDALVASGRRVATVDARGHGLSGKPHDRAYYGEARMSEDVTALIDILGEPAYDLVGYSMGAIVSLLTAARDRRVRRVVVGGVGAGVVELGGVDRRVVGGPALQDALLTDDPASIVEPAAAQFRAFVDAVGGDRVALAAQAASVYRERMPLEEIKVPTLVLAGSEDALAARPEVLAGAVPGAVLRTVPGDHLGVVRRQEFVDELVAFVNEEADAGAA